MSEPIMPVPPSISNDNGAFAFIGADYVEFKPETFKGYFVLVDDVRVGGYQTHAEALAYAKSKAVRVYDLSSVDHYEMDRKKPRFRLVTEDRP
jgi:hypothetical protein